MKRVFDFLQTHSHEVYCWLWALGICGLLLIIMLMVDAAWNVAYKRGFNDGVDSVTKKTKDIIKIPKEFRKEHYYS